MHSAPPRGNTPQRRVNCASHRSQAKAVLPTGTHCMCRQVLHRTLVLRSTVSDSLMAAKQYDHGPKITTTDRQTRSAGDEEVTTSQPGGSDWLGPRRRYRALVGEQRNAIKRLRPRRIAGSSSDRGPGMRLQLLVVVNRVCAVRLLTL